MQHTAFISMGYYEILRDTMGYYGTLQHIVRDITGYYEMLRDTTRCYGILRNQLCSVKFNKDI